MTFTNPHEALRHHVSGAIARGEAEPPGVFHSRNSLRMALDRQGRAETMEEWLADQIVIDRERRYLASWGASEEAE